MQRIALVLFLAACSSKAPVVPPPPPAPTVDRAQVDAWIDELAIVSDEGIGFSASLTGNQFAPLPGTDEQGMILLGQKAPQRSQVLLRLVEAGVAAVPALLACLERDTPTKLPPPEAMMWTAAPDEYDYNRRTSAVPAGVNRDNDMEHPPGPHTITVGNLCFVALGQIVNRSYSAVRYQPTGGLVINSPSASTVLRGVARAEWSGLTVASHQALLVRDFQEPDYPGRREGAMLRLGYYYPAALTDVLKAELARPTYDSIPENAWVRALYGQDPAAWQQSFTDHLASGGDPEALRDGIEQQLFDDLDSQEAYEEKRVSPPTSGADYRARQVLVALYGRPPTIRSKDRPFPKYSESHDRERLIESARKAGFKIPE